MSYILDALRRADAERERGHVPNINAQPTWTAPTAAVGVDRGSSRPRFPAALGVAAGLVLLALATWWAWGSFGPRQGDSGGVGAVTSRAPAPEVSPTLATDGAPQPRSAPATPAATVVAQAVPTVPVAPAATPPAVTTAIDNNPPSVRPARKPAAAPTTAAAAGSNKGPTAAAALPRAGTASAAPSSSAAPPRVYTVDELPEDIRREIPKLAFGGSIYSESSSSRFVIVNGQLFHEGDTLAPGLVLQQIKLKSAVLAFRGYRYGVGL